MKNLFYFFILAVFVGLKATAQDSKQPSPYKVPQAYSFSYKVVYEINNEKKKKPETLSYYFTDNGDYMSLLMPDTQKGEDLVIFTKDGMMVTFGEEADPNISGKQRNVLKVIDMHSMYKGLGKGMTALENTIPKKDNTNEEKEKAVNLDNFVLTGKTKDVFGYTAEEYSKHVSGYEDGKERSGTLYVWYAKVAFDPEMMFSMGLGNMAGAQTQSALQHSHPNNIIGMGIAHKGYLLTEMDFAEDGGESGTPMKVISIEKTNFSKATSGYYIENYSGMSMSQMIMKELEKK